MPKLTTDDLIIALDDIKTPRNIVTVGAMVTGKTSALDCLEAECELVAKAQVGEARFTQARPDEKDKGCTLKFSVTSMIVQNLLLHVVDTPGHAEYGAELSAAMQLADGALVVVDGSGGGMATQTNQQVQGMVSWGG